MILNGGAMSAIGGIIDLKRGSVDFSAFYSMRNALALRGREMSTAYLDLGVAMLYCSDGFFDIDLPIISERRGYATAISYDAYFLEPKAVLERYRAQGVEFISELCEPFAISLYDGERKMLLLARDKKGKKPLFYIARAGRVYFASEPKALLALSSSVRVNAKALSEHLTSPIGIYSASDVYLDICEVRAGECVLFTELGISRFFYRESEQKRIRSASVIGKSDKAVKGFFIINRDSLLASLSDSLIAFDMPQFDAYIPMLSQTLISAERGRLKALSLEDPIKRRHTGYSLLREDRLGAFYRVNYIGMPEKLDAREIDERREKLRDILYLLRDELFLREDDIRNFLVDVFGERKLSYVLSAIERGAQKNEDAEQIVRILGMLLQSLEWSRLRNIELVCKENRSYYYN